jgi:hypothetical protein
MIHLKKLMLSKSYFDRVPAQDAVADNGERYNRVAVTRANNYVMFYVYNGRTFQVDMTKLKFAPSKANWFSPGTGKQQPVEGFKISTVVSFDPPGEQQDGNDWVLILEK